MVEPKISVVMPVYNSSLFLKDSINSILAQSFSNFEFIIINDGSTDNSLELINSFQHKDERIIVINQKHLGITKSLNKGIRNCRGKYVARMDADDICSPKRFELQLEHLEKYPNTDILGCMVSLISEKGKVISSLDALPLEDYQIKWDLIFSTPLLHPTSMIRKIIFRKYGYFDESMLYGQDIAYWRKISSKVVFNNLPEKLMDLRISDRLDVNKQGKQRIARMKSNPDYIYEITGIKIHPRLFTHFYDFFSDGIPHFPIFYPMIAILFRIRRCFIQRYCNKTQKVYYINRQVSDLFLRAVSFNHHSVKNQIFLENDCSNRFSKGGCHCRAWTRKWCFYKKYFRKNETNIKIVFF